VARRREAANSFDLEIQKRARSFYKERLGSLLAEAEHSMAGAAAT
jgi:hypothetical protein